MSQADETAPSGVLVIDGDAMLLADAPDALRSVTPRDLVAGTAVPEAVLVRAMRAPRLQRVGAQSVAVRALQDYPFYAFLDGFEADALSLLEKYRTPVDRLLSIGEPRGPAAIGVADDGRETLLAAVFADLARNTPPPSTGFAGSGGAARMHAKWYFGDVKRQLAAVLGRLARVSARANRPLRLVHFRCGDGAWSLAVDEAITYVGVDDRAEARDAAPDFPVHTLETVSRETIGEVGVFLLTDVFGPPDIDAQIAAIAPLAELAAREATVIGLVPHRTPGGDSHGIIDEPGISRLTRSLQRAFGGSCELRRLATIAHKPYDVLPGTALAVFEVSR